jgi:hypothetical protein
VGSRPGTAASLAAGSRPGTAKTGTWRTTARTGSSSSSAAAAAGVPKEAIRLMRQYHEHSLILRGGRCKAAVDSGVQQQEWEQLEGLLVQLDQVGFQMAGSSRKATGSDLSNCTLAASGTFC